MNEETEVESPGPRPCPSRRGKIARLPQRVRDELNQRLLDGEPGKKLVEWLNGLREVKSVLKLHFNGSPITEQNLSEWKQGGFRDWLAKTEADDWLDDTLAECRELKAAVQSRPSASPRAGEDGKEAGTESVPDKVAGWFFPHYVAAARGQLATARDPAERWSVLRTICADLAGLRRSGHHVERLRIWQEKLRLETEVVEAQVNELTEKQVLDWVKAHPEIKRKIWPKGRPLSPKEKQLRIIQAFGIGDPAALGIRVRKSKRRKNPGQKLNEKSNFIQVNPT